MKFEKYLSGTSVCSIIKLKSDTIVGRSEKLLAAMKVGGGIAYAR